MWISQIHKQRILSERLKNRLFNMLSLFLLYTSVWIKKILITFLGFDKLWLFRVQRWGGNLLFFRCYGVLDAFVYVCETNHRFTAKPWLLFFIVIHSNLCVTLTHRSTYSNIDLARGKLTAHTQTRSHTHLLGRKMFRTALFYLFMKFR